MKILLGRPMNVRINGEMIELKDGITISALLSGLKINPEIIAVEKNGAIIKRDDYGTECISGGDILELIRFMGGGKCAG